MKRFWSKFSIFILLQFPSSYLAEYGFSILYDLLLKKINSLDISKRRDLRLKLTKFVPNIKSLCSRHEVQGSHLLYYTFLEVCSNDTLHLIGTYTLLYSN